MDVEMEYGMTNFYYESHDVKEKKTYIKPRLFGGSYVKEEIVNKSVRETDEEIWKRINSFVARNKLTIINVESITVYKLESGGESGHTEYFSNDNTSGCKIVGYRIFYRKI